jgi:hypothetical protein
MTHPVLSMLPDEVRALHFEQEVDRLDKDLSIEKKKAAVVRDMSILLDLQDVGRSVALRSTAPAKGGRASTPRIHHGEPQRTRR